MTMTTQNIRDDISDVQKNALSTRLDDSAESWDSNFHNSVPSFSNVFYQRNPTNNLRNYLKFLPSRYIFGNPEIKAHQ